MKTMISIFALILMVAPAQAQLFTPSTVGGAALGAVVGGVIGNNTGSHSHGTKGAVIGAVAGGLLGSAYAQSRRERSPDIYYTSEVGSGPVYYYTSGPSYAAPIYHRTPRVARPSRTATTTLLGGLAGAIIGHNNGRRGWEGAAIGAGAGYLLGRLSEPSPVARRVAHGYAPYAYYRRPVTVAAPTTQPPQQITIINNYYYSSTSTPMSEANSMFGR